MNIVINYPDDKRFNLNARKNRILKFLSENITIEYIGPVRTADRTKYLIESLIEKDLSHLEEKREYDDLLTRLERMQEPTLKAISNEVTKSISQFLPDVKKVQVSSKERIRRIMHESCEVRVDDGNMTNLELKGDGIKSLIAISLMHHLAKQRYKGQDIVFAIEEPEAHLHPDSIHKLKDILEDISERYQVIITTHSPIFVDRSRLNRNILVTKSGVKTAGDISEIRKELGVRVSDNLKSSTLVVLVEGDTDIMILKTWLFSLSQKLKEAYNNGLFVFQSVEGAGNLYYQISLYKSLLCNVVVYLDADQSGIQAYKKANETGLILPKDIFIASIRSYRESEIEDLIKVNTYRREIENEFGANLRGPIFQNNRKKWSERVRDIFIHSGIPWDTSIEKSIKNIVAISVENNGLDSLKKPNSSSIKNLKNRLEILLNLQN
jgi:predicted ATP-dependent endonuclease of OLD family